MTPQDMERVVEAVLQVECDTSVKTRRAFARDLLWLLARAFPEHELAIRAAHKREHPDSEGVMP